MKKVLSVILSVLLLLMLLPLSVSADGSKFSCSIQKTVNGAAILDPSQLKVGDVVMVTTTINCSDDTDGSFQCWGLELDLMSLGMEYEEGSAQGFPTTSANGADVASTVSTAYGTADATMNIRFFRINMNQSSFTVTLPVTVNARYRVTEPDKVQAWSPKPLIYLSGSLDAAEIEMTNTVVFNAKGGTLTGASSVSLTAGQTLSLSGYSAARSGYLFLGWTDGVHNYAPGASITVNGDMNLSARWGSTISFDLDGGALSGTDVSGDHPVGKELHLPGATKSGYEFSGWSVGGTTYQAGAAYTVNGNAVLKAVWKTKNSGTGSGTGSETGYESSNGFTDVPKDSYYSAAVNWAVSKGITKGMTDTLFAPGNPCTRAQAVTFLYRAAGQPAVSGKSGFSDVEAGSYYEKAVIWAVSKGITKGTSDTAFNPNKTCTRAEIVTFLFRYAKGTAVNSNAFTDVPANQYYSGAVGWAVSKGITKGTSDTTFSPDKSCTRAEIVTFLYRALG